MSDTRDISAGGVSTELALRMEQLATRLIGAEPIFRSRHQLRFGGSGGLSVEIAGPKRGIWCDFRDGNAGGDALDLVAYVNRCSLAEALSWARAWLGHPDAVPAARHAPVQLPRDDARDRVRNLDLCRRIWSEAVALSGSLGERYLVGRVGSSLPGDGPVRFHPACPCGADRLPALVALMTDPLSAAAVGVHRTYLDPAGGKASIDAPKRMLGSAGVIRLSSDDAVSSGLGLAEGLENALTVLLVTGWAPVWVAGSAGGIASFPVLPGVEALTIFADPDPVGMQAARTCGERWRADGREARIIAPRQGDWCDAANRARAA